MVRLARRGNTHTQWQLNRGGRGKLKQILYRSPPRTLPTRTASCIPACGAHCWTKSEWRNTRRRRLTDSGRGVRALPQQQPGWRGPCCATCVTPQSGSCKPNKTVQKRTRPPHAHDSIARTPQGGKTTFPRIHREGRTALSSCSLEVTKCFRYNF